MKTPIKAFWFEPAQGVLKYHDGRKPVAGETHEVDGPVVPCEHGLHASIRPIDALQYAESNVIWTVELNGEIAHEKDKACATQRTYIQRCDIEDVLFEMACRSALSVIHLWNAPPVVVEFLMTGDKSLRAAASAAASAAARDAASAAAWVAAWDAASAAARDAQNVCFEALILKKMAAQS